MSTSHCPCIVTRGLAPLNQCLCVYASSSCTPSTSILRPILFVGVSRTVLSSLPTEEAKPAIHRLECNLAALRKEEHIPLARLDRLPTLIRNLEVSVHDDLHLVIGVGVLKRSAWVEAVEAGADGLLRVDVLAEILLVQRRFRELASLKS